MSSSIKHAIDSNKFEDQHKVQSEKKKEHKDKVAIKEWASKKEEEEKKPKTFDRHDPAQMELLKKRDIKRYRKEMRKIKREIREKAGLPVGIQVQPKPTRAPEEIKQIRSEMFAKIGSNKRQKFDDNDYQTAVNQQNPDSILEFINQKIRKHIQSQKVKNIEEKDEGEEHGQVNEAIENIKNEDYKLLDNENVQTVTATEKDANLRVTNEVVRIVNAIKSQENQGTKRYNVPQVLVICPDTYNVVDINKELVTAYKHASGLGENGQKSGFKYDIHVQKLFAKHIKPTEQAELLAKKHPNAKQKRVLNIYIGTPNRLLKLTETKAFDIGIQSDRFRNLIIDCRLNKKNITIFETRETRNDTLDLLSLCNTAFKREGDNKLKISLV